MNVTDAINYSNDLAINQDQKLFLLGSFLFFALFFLWYFNKKETEQDNKSAWGVKGVIVKAIKSICWLEIVTLPLKIIFLYREVAFIDVFLYYMMFYVVGFVVLFLWYLFRSSEIAFNWLDDILKKLGR
jgi:hypothetical protein